MAVCELECVMIILFRVFGIFCFCLFELLAGFQGSMCAKLIGFGWLQSAPILGTSFVDDLVILQ
jgi:hypothetical protein